MPTKVLVFGSGDCGQLGLGEDVTELERPALLSFFDDKNIISISAGGLHNLALSSTGTLYSWGCNDEKALGHFEPEWTIGIVKLPLNSEVDEKILKIASGDSISAIVTSEGRVFSWGTFRDSQGVLGFSPSNIQLQANPLLLDINDVKVTEISAGANHLVAIGYLKDQGCILTWGSGEQGQLGRKILARHKTNGLRPENITPKRGFSRLGLSDSKISFSKVSCGSYHTLAISSSLNCTLAWGLNNYGQLGLGDGSLAYEPQNRPYPIVSIGDGLADVVAGEHHSLALLPNGQVYAWGRGDSGQLGVGDSTPSSSIPVHVTGFEVPVRMIACGGNHNLAVDINESLYSWGFGAMGQLGSGSDEDKLKPSVVRLPKSILSLPELRIKDIQAGGQHSLILVQYIEN